VPKQQATIRNGLQPGGLIHLERRFQIWAYSVSHSQLLLRSKKSTGHPTRVDIAFRGVVGMKLPWILESIRIETSTLEAIGDSAIQSLDLFDKDLFACSAGSFSGWVVASAISMAEDEEEFDVPSAVFEPWLLSALG
jgi:hypothetical protein